jgi:hypothetical protein
MGMRLVGWLHRFPVDRHGLLQETDNGVGKVVVSVAGYHVGGAGHFDVLRMRAHLEEAPHPFFGQDI